VQPADRGIGDVHAGPLTDVLQVGQMFQLVRAVLTLDFAILQQIAWGDRRIGRRNLRRGCAIGLRIISRRI
jgi:hypothetical protein